MAYSWQKMAQKEKNFTTNDKMELKQTSCLTTFRGNYSYKRLEQRRGEMKQPERRNKNEETINKYLAYMFHSDRK